MEILVPASSAEVSGVLVEAVIIFQEHFLLLALSSGNKLYFLMVGVKVFCRIKSAFLNVPLSLSAGFYVLCIYMCREDLETTEKLMAFKTVCFKAFLMTPVLLNETGNRFLCKLIFFLLVFYIACCY